MDFSVDEMNYLNRCAVGVSLSDFLARLDFHLFSCSEDLEFYSFLLDFKKKVTDIKDTEWTDLQEQLPFDVPYGRFDTQEYAELIEREA